MCFVPLLNLMRSGTLVATAPIADTMLQAAAPTPVLLDDFPVSTEVATIQKAAQAAISRQVQVVAIAASTGGPKILVEILGSDINTDIRPEPGNNADFALWATGVAPDGHPTSFIRGDLERMGVVTATGLVDQPNRVERKR